MPYNEETITSIQASASVAGRIAENIESSSVIRSVRLPHSTAALSNPSRQSSFSRKVVTHQRQTNAMIGSDIRRKEADSMSLWNITLPPFSRNFVTSRGMFFCGEPENLPLAKPEPVLRKIPLDIYVMYKCNEGT